MDNEERQAMLTLLTTIGGLISAAVTAVATFFLWRVTKTMAEETRRMAEASSRPHVVATILPNAWGMMYADITVENVGTGPAYDIQIRFDPPIPFEAVGDATNPPLSDLSILKPGQSITSFLGPWEPLGEREFTVSASWLRLPSQAERETHSYKLRMSDLKGHSILGAASPEIQTANYIKKIEEALKPVLSGQRKIKIDISTSADRARERAEYEARIAARKLTPDSDT